MSPPSDYKWLTRRRILKQAIALFKEHGYHGVGLEAIMRAAGLTKGAFYVHFASKEDLFLQALQEESRLEALLDDTAEGGLRGVFTTYLSPDHLRESAAACNLPLMALDAARGTPETRREVTEKLHRAVDAMTAMMSGRDQAHRARAAVALLLGGFILAAAMATPQEQKMVLEDCLKAALKLVEQA